MGSDVWGLVETGFKEIEEGLLESVFDKTILKEEKWAQLPVLQSKCFFNTILDVTPTRWFFIQKVPHARTLRQEKH